MTLIVIQRIRGDAYSGRALGRPIERFCGQPRDRILPLAEKMFGRIYHLEQLGDPEI